jgi:hypothetical protein
MKLDNLIYYIIILLIIIVILILFIKLVNKKPNCKIISTRAKEPFTEDTSGLNYIDLQITPPYIFNINANTVDLIFKLPPINVDELTVDKVYLSIDKDTETRYDLDTYTLDQEKGCIISMPNFDDIKTMLGLTDKIHNLKIFLECSNNSVYFNTVTYINLPNGDNVTTDPSMKEITVNSDEMIIEFDNSIQDFDGTLFIYDGTYIYISSDSSLNTENTKITVGLTNLDKYLGGKNNTLTINDGNRYDIYILFSNGEKLAKYTREKQLNYIDLKLTSPSVLNIVDNPIIITVQLPSSIDVDEEIGSASCRDRVSTSV